MIRLMCPNCQSIVSVPDSAAGGNADCPSCSKPFSVPARYTPTVAIEPPPEPPAPPTPVVEQASIPIPPIADVGPSTGYTHVRRVAICPTLVTWLPAVGLVVILASTFFFSWVGMFPESYPAYRQGAWNALIGSFTPADHVLEDILSMNIQLKQLMRSDWALMGPYLLGLLFVVLLAVAERIYHNRPLVPHFVTRLGVVWTHRQTFITAISIGLLCFLVLQMLSGFSLETALAKHVHSQFAEESKKAENFTALQTKIAIQEAMKYASYCLQRTTWLCLVLWLHIIVVVALIARWRLERRGNKPLPRVTLEY